MNEYRPNLKLVVRLIVILSMIAASIIVWIGKGLDYGLATLGIALSMGALGSFLWWVFDNYAWRFQNRICKAICPQPNLNGRWEGVLDSPQVDGLKPIAVEIYQSFSCIRCDIWTDTNQSHSLTASLLSSSDNKRFRLSYLFDAEAPEHESDGHRHCGSVLLDYLLDGEPQLRGTYFTSRDLPQPSNANKTRGAIYLTLVSNSPTGKRTDFDSNKYAKLLPRKPTAGGIQQDPD